MYALFTEGRIGLADCATGSAKQWKTLNKKIWSSLNVGGQISVFHLWQPMQNNRRAAKFVFWNLGEITGMPTYFLTTHKSETLNTRTNVKLWQTGKKPGRSARRLVSHPFRWQGKEHRNRGPLALLLRNCCHLTGAVVTYQAVPYLPSLYLCPLAPRMSPAGTWPSTWVTHSLTRCCTASRLKEGGW